MVRASLESFLDTAPQVVEIAVEAVTGSAPRDTSTTMFVTENSTWGTIGGGRLEHQAIQHAQAMMTGNKAADHMELSLGPEIGQCCGGRVWLAFRVLSVSDRLQVLAQREGEQAKRPFAYVFGSGHVGRALARQLQHLPLVCVLVDSRADQLELCDANVEKRLTAFPEADIKSAPHGAAFIVMTHDHGLDYLLASEALRRGDAAYVGMIGSKTKRAKFRNWAKKDMPIEITDPLICPIGASGLGDKRPSVIAACVAAEVVAVFTGGANLSGEIRNDIASLRRPA
ncbi:MAG: xanthine dehydrogenase accessory protein XdhC [Pseudomonadota bacterium]